MSDNFGHTFGGGFRSAGRAGALPAPLHPPPKVGVAYPAHSLLVGNYSCRRWGIIIVVDGRRQRVELGLRSGRTHQRNASRRNPAHSLEPWRLAGRTPRLERDEGVN